jgi:hypothetical protein
MIGWGLGIGCLILIGPTRTVAGSLVCPPKDLAGRSLQDQSFGTTIFCAYGIGLNCIYNATTGDLMTDNDGGNCPANAVTDIVVPTATPRSASAPALGAWGSMLAALLLGSFGVFTLRHRTRSY